MQNNGEIVIILYFYGDKLLCTFINNNAFSKENIYLCIYIIIYSHLLFV